jgi:hypothetical protein
MKNLSRYLKGGILGMCLEYLYRVEYNIWPLLISTIIIIQILIDIDKKNRLVNFGLSVFIHVTFFYLKIMDKIKNRKW